MHYACNSTSPLYDPSNAGHYNMKKTAAEVESDNRFVASHLGPRPQHLLSTEQEAEEGVSEDASKGSWIARAFPTLDDEKQPRERLVVVRAIFLVLIAMGQINRCLKRCFIIVNVLFGLIGALLLLLAVLGHLQLSTEYEEDGYQVNGLIFTYIFGIFATVFSCLGIYGAYKEKKWALIVFLVTLSLGCIGCLVIAVSSIIVLPKMRKGMEDEFQQFLPLNKSSLNAKYVADELQPKWECCGLFNGYKDWGEHIPHSCLCPDYYRQTDKCEAAEESHLNSIMSHGFNSAIMVYKQSCFLVVKEWMQFGVKLILGITFPFAAVMLLELVMCAIILYQTGQRRPPMGPVPLSNDPKPSKYAVL